MLFKRDVLGNDKYHMISLMGGFVKNDTEELIHKTEADSKILEPNL